MTADPITPELLLARLRDLPALPDVVMELIGSLGSDDLSAHDIAAKLSKDPGLSAKTLRMANSSFYGLPRQIGSIPEAVTILGLRTVRTVILASGVSGCFTVPPSVGFDFKGFWRHALGAAMCGQLLAIELHMDSDIGFTTGLLHDIGQVALACCFPDDYARVLTYKIKHDVPLIDAEQAIIHTDHAVMGARIAEHWRFSEVFVEAIENHHAPAMHHGPGLVGLTHLSDAFSHALGLSGHADETVPLIPPDIWAAMSPGDEQCIRLFAEVEQRFDDVCQALHL